MKSMEHDQQISNSLFGIEHWHKGPAAGLEAAKASRRNSSKIPEHIWTSMKSMNICKHWVILLRTYVFFHICFSLSLYIYIYIYIFLKKSYNPKYIPISTLPHHLPSLPQPRGVGRSGAFCIFSWGRNRTSTISYVTLHGGHVCQIVPTFFVIWGHGKFI